MIFRSLNCFLEFPDKKNKSRNYIIASALRHADLSRSTGLTRVKPDQWGPLLSEPVLVRVADVWAQSTASSAWSELMRGPTVVS